MDIERLIQDGFDAVKTYVDRGFARMAERIEPVEARAPLRGEKGLDGVAGKDGAPGRDGKDGAPGERGLPGEKGLDGIAGKDGAAGRDGKDGAPGERGLPGEKGLDGIAGKDGAPGERGLNGKDGAPGERGLPGEKGLDGIAGKDGAAGAAGLDGKDGLNGKDADPVTRDDIIAAIKSDPTLLRDVVAQFIKDNPVPAGKDGAPGDRGEKGDSGLDGKNGAGVASALIERDGNLVLTLSDGGVQKLGLVVGRDGAAGKDGRDGFELKDFQADHDGNGNLTLRFTSGELQRSVTLPLQGFVDRGVWREGEYKAGDAASWEGSLFIASKDTATRPGVAGSDWRLAVKRGRDGATAFDIAKRAGFKGSETDWLKSLKGDAGPEGRPGRDLTQLGFDGSKR